MPSDQNYPATPKRRSQRAAATVAANRLSGTFRQVSNDGASPPRKRRRPLAARNDSSDFEEDTSDVEMLGTTPPQANSKSNPIILDSPPARTKRSLESSAKPKTAPVVMEVLLPKRARASITSRVPAAQGTSSSKSVSSQHKNTEPSVFKTVVSSKSTRVKTIRVRNTQPTKDTDYIDGDLMLQIWKEGIDRKAYEYSQELTKVD
ncbi:hypothetical protein ACGC1H_007537 [Rhizoctonia solani]|uniref:Uncharacterized protein n=1 Tax=Rhizoctonia solani TaxID=456999 RepID=A0A8H3G771_9AGAM|nr:unnamed protein product [Rhizoctonia solani]